MIIQKEKESELYGRELRPDKIKWVLDETLDKRVRRAAYSICESSEDGVCVYITAGCTDSEEYTLDISPGEVHISSGGARGAFYALQTLKQLINDNGGIVECQKIHDAPDMKYRGFYHDISRGKIPSLETLKQLVDTMAEYKLNSLQLYVEHTFAFKEYEACGERLGYLTGEEIRELDEYCREHFIELVPSVSCFGHLYHLLSDEKYKHLSELPDYVPTSHYWKERMFHHTINPTLEESFELIKGMIDQYLPFTSSNKFNICCDETFDLGTGVNAGRDKARLYIDFVKRLIEYLNSKGKTVMLWGDILLQHPECMSELPQNVLFLNWGYDKHPEEEQYRKIFESGQKQILCPGTSSWNSFAEDVETEESNILTLSEYAHKLGAEGLLTTNWGDLGNMASLTMTGYGMVLSAALSWNKGIAVNDDFRREVSKRLFGNGELIGILAEVSEVRPILNWYKAVTGDKTEVQPGCVAYPSREEYERTIELLKRVKKRAEELSYSSHDIKRQVINAFGGFVITAVASARVDGFYFETGFDNEQWLEEFKALWLEKNKPSELNEAVRIIKERLSI